MHRIVDGYVNSMHSGVTCTVAYTLGYTLRLSLGYTLAYTLTCTVAYAVAYILAYTVAYTLGLSLRLTLTLSLACTRGLRWDCLRRIYDAYAGTVAGIYATYTLKLSLGYTLIYTL